jgi:hypothetical protein
MSDDSLPRNYALVARLRMELKDLLASLRDELEGKTAQSPEAWKLLRDATTVLRHSQEALKLATIEIERLHAELARRKPPGDDGMPETVPVDSPIRPREGPRAAASAANASDDRVESESNAQSVQLARPEADKALYN